MVLAQVLAPAHPLVLPAVHLPGQLGLWVTDEDVVNSSGEHPRMGRVEAGNVPLKGPQVPGLKERIQELQVAQGLKVGLP